MNAFERELRRFAALTRGRVVPRRPRLLTRRATLGLGLGSVGLTALAACGGSSGSGDDGTGGAAGDGSLGGGATGGGAGAGETGTCVVIPEETEGPYPLFTEFETVSQYIRDDITEGRPGLPLQLDLSVVNVNDDCAPITDALVYIWHTDKDGAYSGYPQPGGDTTGETFCRGVQITDTAGAVSFDTIFPGWYQGRITHVHFRVYLSETLAATSQLAFPDAIDAAVYADSLYADKGQNTSVTNNASDGIFADGLENQIATTQEDSDTGGYRASLRIGIAL